MLTVPAVELSFSKPVLTVIGERLPVEMFPEASTSRAVFVVQAALEVSVVAPVM
jgi:hypothetical protein